MIEGHWRAKGQKTLLLEKFVHTLYIFVIPSADLPNDCEYRTKIQIADRIFHFLLPTIDVQKAGGGPSEKRKAVTKEGAAKKGAKVSRGKGKGKGKGKTRVKVDGGEESSSLSEVSDSELGLSPLPPTPADLTAAEASSNAVKPSLSPAAAEAVPSPSLLGSNPSLPPLPGRSSSLPNHPVTTSNGSSRPSRSPLPRQASLRAHNSNSMGPPQRAASRNAIYAEGHNLPGQEPTPSPQPPPPPPTAEELELGRQRAAMIAQLFSGTGQGQGIGGKSPTVVTQASSRRPGTRSGKGKAVSNVVPARGKGPGKGKAPPPRPTQSGAGWGDEEDSDSDSDDDSDEEDSAMAEIEAALVRKTPVKGPSSRAPSPAPSVPASALPPAPPPPPTQAPTPPLLPSAAATKQPKRRASKQTTSASPALPSTSSLDSTSLPSLPPLPTSSHSLPLLPTTSNLLPQSSAASLDVTPNISQSASPSMRPATSPLPPLSTSTTALPLAPSSAFPPADVTIAPQIATASKTTKKKSKSKSTTGETSSKKKKKASAVAAATASIPVEGAPTEPAKPRPPPFTPAAHTPGTPWPTQAPADDLLAKPPYTYASLIAQALATSESRKLTINQITDFITSRWPYFKASESGWQVSSSSPSAHFA